MLNHNLNSNIALLREINLMVYHGALSRAFLFGGYMSNEECKDKPFLRNMKDFLFKSEDIKNPCYIYFIVCRVHKSKDYLSRVKIGISKDVDKRLNELQIGSPHDLSLWYKILVPNELAKGIEADLHRKFRWSKTRGEWFKIHKCIRQWIARHKKLSKSHDDITFDEMLPPKSYNIKKLNELEKEGKRYILRKKISVEMYR